MILSSLDLTDYRNYHALHCSFCPGINLITGANAQGKTNLIESVYYLSIGKAYRQARDEQLIRWGEQAFHIEGSVESRRGAIDIEIHYIKEAKPSKTITVDGFRGTTGESLSGAFTSVLFSPESMAIIKGSPQERRGLLDYDIGQISPVYSADHYKYRRLLAQRNALLKKLGPLSMPQQDKRERLSVWDQQLVSVGSRLIEKRLMFVEKLAPLARLMQRRLTGGKENMEMQYLLYAKKAASVGKNAEGRWDIAAWLREVCESSLEDDLRFGSTQWGPHRDDIRITVDGMDVRRYGSQGQQRTAILSVKLAELELFRGESGEYPILLLDDVLSELDESRQQQLLEMVNEKWIQCLITSTEAKNIVLIEKRQNKRFLVNRGEIKEN